MPKVCSPICHAAVVECWLLDHRRKSYLFLLSKQTEANRFVKEIVHFRQQTATPPSRAIPLLDYSIFTHHFLQSRPALFLSSLHPIHISDAGTCIVYTWIVYSGSSSDFSFVSAQSLLCVCLSVWCFVFFSFLKGWVEGKWWCTQRLVGYVVDQRDLRC